MKGLNQMNILALLSVCNSWSGTHKVNKYFGFTTKLLNRQEYTIVVPFLCKFWSTFGHVMLAQITTDAFSEQGCPLVIEACVLIKYTVCLKIIWTALIFRSSKLRDTFFILYKKH